MSEICDVNVGMSPLEKAMKRLSRDFAQADTSVFSADQRKAHAKEIAQAEGVTDERAELLSHIYNSLVEDCINLPADRQEIVFGVDIVPLMQKMWPPAEQAIAHAP